MTTVVALVSNNQKSNGHQMAQPLSQTWADMIRQIQSGQDHVILSINLTNGIGYPGLQHLTDKLSDHLNVPITVMIDGLNGVVRLLPPPNFKNSTSQPTSADKSIKDVPKQTSESAAGSSVVATPVEAGSSQKPIQLPPVALAGNRSQRRGRKTQPARPMNCFILYRQQKHREVVEANPGLHNKAISKIIGQMWHAEPEAVRAAYKSHADMIADAFRLANPCYVYRPRRSADVKRRLKKREPAAQPEPGAQLAPAQATTAPTGDYHVADGPLGFVDPAVFENHAQVNMNCDEPHLTSDNIRPEITNEEQLDNVRPSINMAPASTYDQHAFANVVGHPRELYNQARNNCTYEGDLSGDVSTFLGSVLEHRQHFNFNIAPAQLPYDEFLAATERNAEYVAQGVLEPYANFTFPEREQNLDFTLLDDLDFGISSN